MKKIILSILVILLIASTAFACSNFRIKAKDGTIVIGRSMEFPIDLKSDICIVPRGKSFSVVNSKGIKGLTWTTKYGILGINAFKQKDCFVDGFNEKGLCLDGLMYTGAVYEQAVYGKYVPLDKLGVWALGNFATVSELKAVLKNIKVTDSENKKLKGMGMHVAFHDAQGQSLVIEFINGKASMYDNPLGVMTNRPSFDWQITNLRNYINLEANDIKPKNMNGIKIEPAGVGSGMLGLPGDWTPPSRFVRLALCVSEMLTDKNSTETINTALHLLNVVDIPKGLIKEHPEPFITLDGYAQWVIVQDLTNKVLYFKTYDDPTLKSVDLKKFDLKPGTKERSIAIGTGHLRAIDVSGNLK